MENLIELAKNHAIIAHAAQMYGDDKPYRYHLEKVVSYAELYLPHHFQPIWPEIAAVGWLHDVLEDTKFTYQELKSIFGPIVADAVDCLTDVAGQNRKIRKLNTWHKIRSNPISTYVKLCDRMANTVENGKKKMYREEFPLFQAALYVPGQFENLWADLEQITNTN